MPISWETPKGIDPYLASILVSYLISIKSKIPYIERSITRPTLEVTSKDVKEDILPCWWLFMKTKLKEFKIDQKRYKTGHRKTFMMWYPEFYLQYPKAWARMHTYINKLSEEQINKAREELRQYIGFQAYAYRKSEIRDLGEEHIRE